MTGSFRDLTVYKKTFSLAMLIHMVRNPEKYRSKYKKENITVLPTAICQLPTEGLKHCKFDLSLY